MTTKIARFMRELERPAPSSPEKGPHVMKLLFKVTPAMEWTDYVTWRKGRLLNDLAKTPRQRERFPHRMRRSMEKGFFSKPDPKYGHGQRQHTTAFVVASASDLKTYMNASNDRMIARAREQKAFYEKLPVGNPSRAEGIRQAEETISLFTRPNRIEFEVETFLFPADKFGEVKDYGEMEGSQKGTLDHRKPFEDVGYTVVGDLPIFRWPKPPLELEVEVDMRPVIEIKDWEVMPDEA
jgi:hypothetical protein